VERCIWPHSLCNDQLSAICARSLGFLLDGSEFDRMEEARLRSESLYYRILWRNFDQ
jgi:hypothetical protein